MSETVDRLPATTEERRDVETAAAPKELDDLHTEHGDTSIADTVVSKLAGIAAREVPGVYAMGNVARRAIGSLAGRVSGQGQNANVTGGVSVEKGERETAVELSVVVEYGVSIADVTTQIRENVIRAVEYGTGLTVVSVNIAVTDVHLPSDDQDADATAAPALA